MTATNRFSDLPLHLPCNELPKTCGRLNGRHFNNNLNYHVLLDASVSRQLLHKRTPRLLERASSSRGGTRCADRKETLHLPL